MPVYYDSHRSKRHDFLINIMTLTGIPIGVRQSNIKATGRSISRLGILTDGKQNASRLKNKNR